MAEHMKMYKDDAVVYGIVAEPLRVNFPPDQDPADYQAMICADGRWWRRDDDPPDGDLLVNVYVPHAWRDRVPTMWTQGFIWNDGRNIAAPLLAKLDATDNRIHCEALMYGRSAGCGYRGGLCAPLLPGWAEDPPLAVTVNTRPIARELKIGRALGDPPQTWEASVPWAEITVGTAVCARGFLTLDCHDLGGQCYEDEPYERNIELHPLYSLDTFANPGAKKWAELFDLKAELWELLGQVRRHWPPNETFARIADWHTKHDEEADERLHELLTDPAFAVDWSAIGF